MDRLEALFDLVLDGELGQTEAAELEDLLHDADHRQRWARLVILQGGLQEGCRELACAPAAEETLEAVLPPLPRRRRPLRLILPVAGSLLAACLVVAVLLLQRGPVAPGHLVVAGGADRAITNDSPVSGPGQVRLADGSTVQLRPASRIRLADSERGLQIHLEAGSLLVQAAPQKPGKQLTVVAPDAIARVLGTRFELRCGEDETRLYVEEGKVAFGRNGEEIVVAAGGAAYARRDNGVLRLAQSAPARIIDLRDQAITSKLQEQGWSGSWSGDGLRAVQPAGKPYVQINSADMPGGFATVADGMDLHLHCTTDHRTWLTVVLILADQQDRWQMNIKALQRIDPGADQHLIVPWTAWESYGFDLGQAVGSRIKRIHVGAVGDADDGSIDFRLHQISVHPPP